MITVENSLKSGANKRRLGEKLWLVFVLANAVLFLVAVCISVFWPSELPKFVSSLTIVSGLALIYAYLIEWCLDALASKQSKSALEILERDNDKLREENNKLQKELDLSKRKLEKTEKRLYVCHDLLDEAKRNFVNAEVSNDRLKKRLDRELEDAHKETNLYRDLFNWAKRRFVNAEASNDRLKKSLRWSLTNCRKLRKELSTTKRELEDAHKELGLANLNADNALYARDTARDIAKGVISERNGLRTERDELLAEIDKLKRENFALREELGDTDDALVESCSQLASVCSKLDGLQSKLSKLVAERNQLQYEVYGIRKEHDKLQTENDDLCKKLKKSTEKVDWFRREYFEVWRKTLRQSYNAKRQVASLESILKNLDEATEIADLREKLKMVINGLSAEDSRE